MIVIPVEDRKIYLAIESYSAPSLSTHTFGRIDREKRKAVYMVIIGLPNSGCNKGRCMLKKICPFLISVPVKYKYKMFF